MTSSLQPTLSEFEVQSILVHHRSYSRDEEPTKIRQAQSLIETIPLENVFQAYKGKHIYLKRFLKTFLDEAPSRMYVAHAILDDYPALFPDHDLIGKFRGLATIWLNCFLLQLKDIRRTSPTPPTLSTPLTPSAEETFTTLETAQQHQEKLTKDLLARDNNRDVIQGKISMSSTLESVDEPFTYTNAAHILPFSMNTWAPTNPPDKTTVLWDVLANWSSYDITQLKGELINRAGNALTLDGVDHLFFGAFKIWFESTGQPNQYKISSAVTYEHKNKIVTFRDHSNRNIELPDPKLLRIHAAVARVLHLSGAAEIWDDVERDGQGQVALSRDGSDAALLAQRLWASGNVISVNT